MTANMSIQLLIRSMTDDFEAEYESNDDACNDLAYGVANYYMEKEIFPFIQSLEICDLKDINLFLEKLKNHILWNLIVLRYDGNMGKVQYAIKELWEKYGNPECKLCKTKFSFNEHEEYGPVCHKCTQISLAHILYGKCMICKMSKPDVTYDNEQQEKEKVGGCKQCRDDIDNEEYEEYDEDEESSDDDEENI